jgi:hypothetical protein
VAHWACSMNVPPGTTSSPATTSPQGASLAKRQIQRHVNRVSWHSEMGRPLVVEHGRYRVGCGMLSQGSRSQRTPTEPAQDLCLRGQAYCQMTLWPTALGVGQTRCCSRRRVAVVVPFGPQNLPQTRADMHVKVTAWEGARASEQLTVSQAAATGPGTSAPTVGAAPRFSAPPRPMPGHGSQPNRLTSRRTAVRRSHGPAPVRRPGRWRTAAHRAVGPTDRRTMARR